MIASDKNGENEKKKHRWRLLSIAGDSQRGSKKRGRPHDQRAQRFARVLRHRRARARAQEQKQRDDNDLGKKSCHFGGDEDASERSFAWSTDGALARFLHDLRSHRSRRSRRRRHRRRRRRRRRCRCKSAAKSVRNVALTVTQNRAARAPRRRA